MSQARPLTAEDILSIRYASDAQITPDGDLIAFTTGEPFKDGTRIPKSQIWIVPAAGGEARQFTGGPRSDVTPRWSPDGQWLAFLSDRLEDGRHQLFVMPRGGGEAQALTDVKGEISWIHWSPDGREIALLLTDPETDEERKRKEAKDDAIEYERRHKFARVWILEVATKALRCVTTADVQVWEASWSPDGQHFALIVSDEPYEWAWYLARLSRVPASGGELVTLLDPQPRHIATPVWAPDGRRIAYLSCTWSDRGSVGGDLYVLSADGGPATNLTQDYHGSVRWMTWEPDGQGLLALATEDARSVLAAVSLDGGLRRLWSAPVGLSERFQPCYSCAGRRLATIQEDSDHPRDVWVGDQQADGSFTWRQLTRLNPHTAEWTLGAVEEVRWHSTDGLALQGFLIKPVGWEPGRRVPLFTVVHGGPTSLNDFRYSASGLWSQLLATRGYAVFLPNPRGSTGWGTAFAESNLGDMGGKDMTDILAGVDHLVALGIADPDRLGIGGWSYGGFMTAWLITQTQRFKAAVAGAAVTNWLSFHGASILSTWDQQYLLTSPYDDPGGVYDRFSPMRHVRGVTTPTLILHGESDMFVPVSQGYELFRALKESGVPTALVVYPREGHGPIEKPHRIHVMNAVVEWLERYLPSTDTPSREETDQAGSAG